MNKKKVTRADAALAVEQLQAGKPIDEVCRSIGVSKTALERKLRELERAWGHISPGWWPEYVSDLGDAYLSLETGDRAANLLRAVECYETYLLRSRSDIHALHNLGVAYRRLPVDRDTNLNQAIECFEAVLDYASADHLRPKWALAQRDLGLCYEMATEKRSPDLPRAIECYEAVLQVFNATDDQGLWADALQRLSRAYLSLPTGDRGANLAAAIGCAERALEVLTEAASPTIWAAFQKIAGDAYIDLAAGDNTAVACYEAALRVFTRQSSPQDWSDTLCGLACALRGLDDHSQAERLLREAMSAQPQNARALYLLAAELLRAGEREAAIPYIQDALKLHRDRDSYCPAMEDFAGLLEDTDASTRVSAVRVLCRTKDRRVVESLIRAIGDPDAGVRETAGQALSEMLRNGISCPQAVEPLIIALEDDHSSVAQAAACALGWTKDARAVAPLTEALSRDSLYVAPAAARALGQIGHTSAVVPLLEILTARGSENMLVAGDAAEALGEIGDPRALDPLIEALLHHPFASAEAALALGSIGDPRAVEALMRAAEGYYDAFYEDEYHQTQADAVWALGEIGDKRAVGVLTQALEHGNVELDEDLEEDGSERVRAAAAEALGKIRKPLAARESLKSALEDESAVVRRAAVAALVGWPGPDSPLGRVEALAARSHFGASELRDTVKRLISVRTSRDGRMRRIDAKALGAMVELLLRVVGDAKEVVRKQAVQALAEMAKPTFPIRPRDDSDSDARTRADRTHKEIVRVLAGVLGDADEGVRTEAAQGLGEIRDPLAVGPLIEALEDRDIEIPEDRQEHRSLQRKTRRRPCFRERVVWALGQIGDPQAVEALATALERDNDSVREAAVRALGSIDDPRAMELVIMALADGAKRVKRAVAELLPLGERGESPDEALRSSVDDLDDLDDLRSGLDRFPLPPSASTVTKSSCDPGSVLRYARQRHPLDMEKLSNTLELIGPRVVGLVIKALEDEDKLVRQAAVLVLATIGAPALEPLVGALRGSAPTVLPIVVGLLALIKDPRA